jgi:hypothetical protein
MDPATLEGWTLFAKTAVFLLAILGVDLGVAYLTRGATETDSVLNDRG